MDERGGEDARRSFLPPQPAGPEPDLGAPPAPRPPPAHRGFLPPEEAEPHGYVPPAGPPPGHAGPPSGAVPGAEQQQFANRAPPPAGPDNGHPLPGLVLSVSAAGLLLLSVGMSSIISVVCAALGIYYSRK